MAFTEEMQQRMDRRLNQIMAILLPLLEFAAIGYCTYVIVYLICIQYLISPSPNLHLSPRNGTGIALIVVYCVLLLIFALSFLRLLQVIWVNPGVVPLGESSTLEKEGASMKHFDRLDAYICDYQGAPLWCHKCHNWKPDRAHHSSQLGRCIYRMDHFCPYAGGIISETSYKFFVQFLFYGAVYTGYGMIVIAVFLAEKSKQFDSRPASWIVAIALAALFFLFTFGMWMTTFYNMALNYTTVEVMQRGGIYHIAMRGKMPPESPPTSETSQSKPYPIVCEVQRSPSLSYIVVKTEPFVNPWEMDAWSNIKDYMGTSVLDWFLPWKMSPCIVEKDHRGEFKWGTEVKQLMEEFGAGEAYARRSSSSRSRRRRRSRSDQQVPKAS